MGADDLSTLGLLLSIIFIVLGVGGFPNPIAILLLLLAIGLIKICAI